MSHLIEVINGVLQPETCGALIGIFECSGQVADSPILSGLGRDMENHVTHGDAFFREAVGAPGIGAFHMHLAKPE